MTRRQKFRQYMACMSAAADPKLAIEREFYVPPPDAISDRIVKRLEIEPSSRHLIVGSIGAGKTTQLLIAQKHLEGLEDVHALYVDVSERHDLTQLRPGCLVALAGIALDNMLGRQSINAPDWPSFKSWASGYWTFPYDDYHDEYDDGSKFVQGIIKPPTSWPDIPQNIVSIFSQTTRLMMNQGPNLILLFDSLDRVTNRDAFSKIVEQDVAALHGAGIGLVLIGPIRSLEGFGRLDADRFDYLHVQAPIDVGQDEKGREFLLQVLHRRAGPGILSDTAAEQLVQLSGGVLRDLIALAKSAGDEAYSRGADTIDRDHVMMAADGFGRALMVGLKPEEIDTLKHLHSTGGFVRTSDDDLALIATRRVLEYRGRQPQYAVHPTISHLLDQLAERP
ncbi:hypothetical protein [Archangium sp.]|uniref:hypothetical protein n=1 Tax=Archangium sp. TaxID=1872627 RepID=UPI002D6646A4|nr:hypothetical protein [Archangium sp.]HYO57456.1 hypothetical protein [Archangium sp.]